MATAGTAKLAPDADLYEVAQKLGIEFFIVCFVDVFGVLRSKMVPAEAINFIQKEGAGFAPMATWHDYGPECADMTAIPDASTLIQVPFQKDLGFVIGDLYIEGQKVQDSPRWVLKDVIAKAAAEGYEFKTGVEPEFFLLSEADILAISDTKDTERKPCYETQALMRRYAVLKEIMNALNAAGFGIYQCDHEDANGQFEINWHYSDCLTTADRYVFFKFVAKTLAEKHGFKATFMPRPFAELTGSGCHCHCSLWKEGQNVFAQGNADSVPVDEEEFPAGVEKLGLSVLGCRFMGGVLTKAPAYCAMTNPTVNSYKRLAGAITSSGSTWAPNRVSFSGNNRTNMVRVLPERFEVRLADGAVNPYLMPAILLAAGLWGLKTLPSTKPFYFDPKVNMFLIPDDSPLIASVPRLPANLLDALRSLEADPDMKDFLGEKMIASFLRLKKAEWKEYMAHLSSWELRNTLDC
ncbi:unnamed protein product [Polarella glacialis]|uniref:Glutamine synthetase n=3 Tax=Polarella glacialis TaxID=89957 RepID=A0A813FEW3_POLGL|nr:unnamed protein product [Polarella glacialis]